MAGRNEARLRAVIDKFDLKLDVITASLDDMESMDTMCSTTKVIISTSGPFAQIGTPLVDACVRSGTHYVDITGEGQWVRKMIDKHHDEAKAKGLKIVPCCGFDCIPPDLACLMMTNFLKENKQVVNIDEVRFVVTEANGGVSGGTLASVINLFATSSYSLLLKLGSPYFLNPFVGDTILTPPREAGIKSRNGDRVLVDYDGMFTQVYKYLFSTHNNELQLDGNSTGYMAPWVMQAINTRVVNRSNALSTWSYGEQFVYSERLMMRLFPGLLYTLVVQPAMMVMLLIPPFRWLLKKVVPQPGDGPSVESEKSARFRALMWGKGSRTNGEEVTVCGSVSINGDAGYRKTATMLSEAALSLALDFERCPSNANSFGVVTPATGMGKRLLERFDECKAEGIVFKCYDKEF